MNQQKELEAHFERNMPAYLDLLRQMVEINSFTENSEGVNRLGQFTTGVFTPLGFTAEAIPSDNPRYGNHLVLTKRGKSNKTIGLISHLDTVFPPEEESRNQFHWQLEGNRIYGPGVVDIKGGTVMIYMVLAALRRLYREAYEEITWVILLDASEERDGTQFGHICLKHLAENGLAALIFEGGKWDGHHFKVVVARKGMALYQVKVTGRSAHAGNDHALGANAIVQLADTIQKIASLTDYERQLTFNVGQASGGVVTNRVAHQAEAKGEMRAFSVDIYNEGLVDLLALDGQSTVQSATGDYACQVQVEVTDRVLPWPRNNASNRLLQLWQSAAEALGMAAIPEERGGLSDGNHLWQKIPTIDGLGPDGANMHCSERSADGSKEPEYLLVDSFVPRAMLNTLAILKLIETRGIGS